MVPTTTAFAVGTLTLLQEIYSQPGHTATPHKSSTEVKQCLELVTRLSASFYTGKEAIIICYCTGLLQP